MISLLGKKIFIVGGNGYIGNFIAAKMVQQQAIVYCLTRRGTSKYEYPQNANINWLKGDVTKLQNEIKQKMNQADIIIHSAVTVGEVFKKKQTLNYNSFKSTLDTLENNKKVIYVSTETLPKEINSKYFQVKRQSQKYLLNSEHQGYVLRPGMVYNADKRKWSMPLVGILRLWSVIYRIQQTFLTKIGFSDSSSVMTFLKYFKGSTPTSLQNVAKAVVYIAKNEHKLQKRTFEPKQIQQI